MAWAVHSEWGRFVDEVKQELREIIATVAEYETVKLLTPPDQITDAQHQSFGPNVEILPAPVDDIWMRDIAPTFALRGNETVAIDWNFNGWGSTSERRSRPGDRLAGRLAASIGIPTVSASFIAEAGAIVTDGQGTIITTKSCLLNPNRNPSYGRAAPLRMEEIERGLSQFGGRTIIWLEGDKDEPITSGHTDGYVLFAQSGALLIEGVDPGCGSAPNHAADIDILRTSKDSRGRSLDVTIVLPPRYQYWRFAGRSFAPCYLNAYIANGAVITGRFGDSERDEKARCILASSFPGRDVRMITLNHIAAGGGGVHCLTQPMPSMNSPIHVHTIL